MQQTSSTAGVTGQLRQWRHNRQEQRHLPYNQHSPDQVSLSQHNLARQQPTRGLRFRRSQQQPQPLRAALSQYRLTRQPGWLLDWFQQAVREIVRRLEEAPFLELVRLPAEGGSQHPHLTNQPVAESAVPLPQLWGRIAEGLGGSNPDVLILVQQVSTQPECGGGAAAAEAAAAAAAAAGQATATGVLCALLLACTSPGGTRGKPGTDIDRRIGSEEGAGSSGSSSSSSRHRGHGRNSSGSGQEPGRGDGSNNQGQPRRPSSGSGRAVPEMEGRLACELLVQYSLGSTVDAMLASSGPGSENNSSLNASCHAADSNPSGTARAGELAAVFDAAAAALVPSQQAQRAVAVPNCQTSSSLRIQPGQVSDAATQELLPTRHPTSHSSVPAPATAGSAAPACCPPTTGSCMDEEASTGWYGLVVQSEQQTGAEGCYLLKVVQSSCPASVAPCVHFSLTKISERGHLEQQFVDGWLV